MKKFLIRTTILVVLMLVGYLCYQYLQDDYIPEYKREFHSLVPKKGQSFVKRKQYHEVVEEAYGDEIDKSTTEVTGKNKNSKVELLLHEVMNLLKDKNTSCEKYIEGFMPNESLIDAESDIYNNADMLRGKLEGAFENSFRRDIIFDSIEEIAKILEGVDKLGRDMFYQVLRSLMICRNGDLSILLEGIHDAKISDTDKDKLTKKIVEILWASIREGDALPDNMLFTIQIMRQIGEAKKLGPTFESELDDIHERIANFDEFYFEEIHSSDYVQSPLFRFRAYLDEMREISDEVMFLMKKAFPDYNLE